MNVKELALKYYPVFWNLSRIKALVLTNNLTEDEYKEITGEDYTQEGGDI